jgi:hypothetical protein
MYHSFRFADKQCDTSQLDNCPPASDCFEINGKVGECRCRDNHDWNGNSFEDNSYCIESTKSTISDRKRLISSDKNTVPHQHLIGGIVLPIFIVCTFLGLVFVFMKLEIYQKCHDLLLLFRPRSYQNVSVNNDLDDDPLLI